MNTLGMLLLAAATATSDGWGYSKPFVSGHKLFRHHAVMNGPVPPGGMVGGPGAGSPGCQFGHPGCAGGATCPGGGPMGGPGGPGAGGPGAGGRRFPNVRSQLFFVDPPGMKIGWQTATGGPDRVYLPGQLTVPARYNFVQGYIYRLKLTDIPGHPGLQLYPTIEVAPSTPATDAYLTHNAIPAQFTEEDFDQVQAGNFVTKVIYLPDPRFQELAIAGVETLVSTRLEPGVDPILEADRRGTILMIIRLGGIDLEMPPAGTLVPSSPVVSQPAATTTAPPMEAVPANPEAGGAPFTPRPGVPVDNAPVTPAPPAGAAPNVPPAAPAEQPAPGNPPAEQPAPVEQPAPANPPGEVPPGEVPPAEPPPAEPPGGANPGL